MHAPPRPSNPLPECQAEYENGRIWRYLRVEVGLGFDRLRALGQPPAQPGLDERVDLAVQHRLGVADLQAGPDVLDQGVRLQDVVPDLGPELGRQELAPDLVHLLRGLLLLPLE